MLMLTQQLMLLQLAASANSIAALHALTTGGKFLTLAPVTLILAHQFQCKSPNYKVICVFVLNIAAQQLWVVTK
jgi:hypothetical protein